MNVRLGVVMDSLENIKIQKDSTFAVLLEAQKRSWEIYYMQQQDLYYAQSQVFAHVKKVKLQDNSQQWFSVLEEQAYPLAALDILLMRKDPPFNVNYVYTTYLLEQVEKTGVLVINKPQSLRDANEKLFTLWFPQCCPEMIVTSQATVIKNFYQQYKDIVLKPLHGMGGEGIFRITENEKNLAVIIELLTQNQQVPVIAQRYLPEIVNGDKRIFMINGKPLPYALARIPKANETRGNLAAGGTAKGVRLTARDEWICQQVGETLREKGLFWVGLDIIGDYLTEINVTSPTCVREISAAFSVDIAKMIVDGMEDIYSSSKKIRS